MCNPTARCLDSHNISNREFSFKHSQVGSLQTPGRGKGTSSLEDSFLSPSTHKEYLQVKFQKIWVHNKKFQNIPGNRTKVNWRSGQQKKASDNYWTWVINLNILIWLKEHRRKLNITYRSIVLKETTILKKYNILMKDIIIEILN